MNIVYFTGMCYFVPSIDIVSFMERVGLEIEQGVVIKLMVTIEHLNEFIMRPL